MQNTYLEKDFIKWYKYSQSSKCGFMSARLRKVIENKSSMYEFLIEINGNVGDEIYYITEKYNPGILELTQSTCNELLDYINSCYPEEEYIINEQSAPEVQSISNIKQETGEIIVPEKPVPVSKNTFLLKIFQKISSVRFVKHSFNFGLLCLILLQPLILPGNIGYSSFGNPGAYFFWGIDIMVWVLCIWTYSKLFSNLKTYGQIFKLTALYNVFISLFIILEITIISSFTGEIVILFYLFLLIVMQIIGLFFTLIQTMIMYFIKGGKLIVFDKRDFQ